MRECCYPLCNKDAKWTHAEVSDWYCYQHMKEEQKFVGEGKYGWFKED